MMRRAWMVWSGIVVGVVVMYFTVLGDPWRGVAYDAAAFGAAAAVLVGVRLHQPVERKGWLLLGAGIAAWAIGDSIWTATEMVSGTVPFPSVADVVYLAGYVLIGAGVVILCRARGVTRRTVRDTLAVGLAIGAIGLAPLFSQLTGDSSPLLTQVVAAIYPAMTWVVLLAAICLGLSGGFRHPAERLLLAGLTTLLITDVIYSHLSLSGSYTSGSPVDAGWLFFYLAIGAAALHPSMVDVGSPQRQPGQLTAPRLAVLCLALISNVFVEVMHIEPHNLLSALWAVVVALVIWRIWDLVAGLDRAALHDALTGLPNSALLKSRIDGALASARGRHGVVAVCFCDIDDFKRVNDSLGHHVGDELLRGVAERLGPLVRTSDTLARLGGDEFVILIADAVDEAEIEMTANRIRTALEPAVVLPGGAEFFVTMSVGVRVVEAGWTGSVDELLRDADAAMYVAKDRGRNQCALFHPLVHDTAVRRLRLAADLREALVVGDIEVHYQPEVELAGGALFGFEALARWWHPEYGFIPPPEFIEVAEAHGLIDALFARVLDEALKQQARWVAELGWVPQVAVNLSPRQLTERNLASEIRQALQAHGRAPEDLCIELTESGFATDAALAGMHRLGEIGIRIAVDDFGTGYSSLALLRRMPVDILKIDRAFTCRLGNPADDALVEAIIDMAHKVGARTVAEGVETTAQLETLQRLGCDVAQGWAMAKAGLGDDALQHVGPTGHWHGPAAEVLSTGAVNSRDG